MPKPVGVIILAILDFIGAAGCALFGLLAIFGMGMLGPTLSQNPEIGPEKAAWIAGAGMVVAIVCFFFAALLALLGYGMLNLRNWARIITLVLAGIAIVLSVLGIAGGAFRFGAMAVVTSTIRLGINLFIVWYLTRPYVKLAFETSSLPTVPPAGMPGSAGAMR
jgi:uncharacterized membrane protein (DUF2068 family)